MAVTAEIFYKRENHFNLIEFFKDHGFCYGSYDEFYRLVEDGHKQPIVFYKENQFARGIEGSWTNEKIELSLFLPDTKGDFDLFIEMITLLLEELEIEKVYLDGCEYTLNNLKEAYSQMVMSNQIVMDMLVKSSKENHSDIVEIFGVKNPLALSAVMMECFEKNQDEFASWLDSRQNFDYYYAVPLIFTAENNKTIGVYCVPKNAETILPDFPNMRVTNRKDIDAWYLMLDYSERFYPYEKGLDELNITDSYDAENNCYILNELSLKTMINSDLSIRLDELK